MTGGGVTSGSLDPAFGSGGITLTGYGGRFDTAAALALTRECALLVAGSSGFVSPNGGAYDIGLLRLAPDGNLDAGFGTGGTVTLDVGGREDGAAALALQPDGKAIVAGRTAVPGGTAFALSRFNPDGTLDAGFGMGGRVITGFPDGSARASAVAVQHDGRILAAGSVIRAANFASVASIGLARYTPDGALDPTFGAGGRVTTAFEAGTATAAALLIDTSGRLIVAGAAQGTGTVYLVVLRYQPDGALDPTFGGRGWTATDLGGDDSVAAAALQEDGRIVVAGRTTTGTSTRGDMVRIGANQSTRVAVARYLPDGSLDLAFGAGGTATFHVGERDAAATAVAVKPDGGIVIAGSTESGGSQDLALVRLTAAGSLDSSFGAGGVVLTDVGGEDRASALAIQPDGAIVVAGSSYLPDGPTRVAVLRYR